MGDLKVKIGDVNLANLEQFKTLTVSTLPVRYSDKFYKELLDKVPKDYIKFAFCDGFAVGSICCRLEDSKEEETQGKKRLYIMTISCLPAYRRRGIASKLLNHVLEKSKADESVYDVYLHVQTSNEDAIAFYEAKGFEKKDKLENYYKRIEPNDAYILQLSLV
jgi:N-alpha-acetyltransferase 50